MSPLDLNKEVNEVNKEKPSSLPKNPFPNDKTIYGPVKSWRFGLSLGIDPIFNISTCSFNCTYCQLGHIQNITNQIDIYVPTSKVLQDFDEFCQKQIPFDVITFSGSGEPTLALNLGEMAQKMKKRTPDRPLLVLTNATLLGDPRVQENLQHFEKVILKLDAADEETFTKVNRPAPGISLATTLEGIFNFQKNYQGEIEIQSMFMPMNLNQIDSMAEIFKKINPKVVQLNTPKRPYPLSWHRENRGNHEGIFHYEVRKLKTINLESSQFIEQRLRELTGLTILSVYQH